MTGDRPSAVVRDFAPDDLNEVVELVRRTVEVCYQGAYPPSAIAFFKDYHNPEHVARDARGGLTIVTLRDERIVGTGTLLRGEIKRVFVAPEHQGKGHGRMIMDVLLNRAFQLGLREVRLDASVVSRDLYLHLGFRPVREDHLELPDGHRLDYTLMERAI